MKLPYLTESMSILKDMYRGYGYKSVYRLSIGEYVSTFVNMVDNYIIIDDIKNNLNPDELFFIIFEVVLTTMSSSDHIDDLSYMDYSQEELTLSLSEYTNIELKFEILHIPNKLIEYVRDIIVSNIDTNNISENVFMIDGYNSTKYTVVVDIYIKERIDV